MAKALRGSSTKKETLRVYGGSDYAVTADGGDYTVHAVVGLDPESIQKASKQPAFVRAEVFNDLLNRYVIFFPHRSTSTVWQQLNPRFQRATMAKCFL